MNKYKVILTNGYMDYVDADTVFVDEGVLYFFNDLQIDEQGLIDLMKSSVLAVYAAEKWERIVKVDG